MDRDIQYNGNGNDDNTYWYNGLANIVMTNGIDSMTWYLTRDLTIIIIVEQLLMTIL